MAERVRVRELDDEEGNRLLRIIRRGSGSVVTWRRAQMVLLSVQGMSVARIAQASMIRRYIAWRNRHTHDPKLRRVIERANVA